MEPAPSFRKTYKRADGDTIGDDWGWITDTDVLDNDEYPSQLIEETWERVAVRKFWHFPHGLYACEIEDEEPCEEDAVAWWREGESGSWLQVCEEHKAEGSVDPLGAGRFPVGE
jgi:hypothetical protein